MPENTQAPLVALVTTTAYIPAPGPDDWYNQQVHEEDRLLSEGLAAHGLRAQRVDWNDPNFDWRTAACAVLRTPWDYSYRFVEFSAWLDSVAAQTRVVNAPEVLRWNMDKHYLADLERGGAAVVETVFFDKGDSQNLARIAEARSWNEIVIKPAVSGGARNTFRAAGSEISALQSTFDECVAAESMLVQPFQKEILDSGEVSLMLMGGHYTHAIRKLPKAGDFRVQDDHGGTVHPYTPTPEVIAAAEAAVAACPTAPLYARVDLVLPAAGPRLMELELVEPELWMRFHPPSARAFADAIAAELGY